MHIQGEKRFDSAPAEVYRALTDPDALGNAFSVIERVEADGRDWTVFVRLPVPGSFRLRLAVHLRNYKRPSTHGCGHGGRPSAVASPSTPRSTWLPTVRER